MKFLARYVFALVLVAGAIYSGCGGGSKPAATPSCVRPSDCNNPMVCNDRFCVGQCVESRDCTNGARCILGTDGNTCQPPEKKTCKFNSECTPGLVCGGDGECRNQCKTDVDCAKGQKCTTTTLLCADPLVDKNYDPDTNDFKNASGSGGTPADGGPIGSGGSTGTGGSGNSDAATDVPSSNTDGSVSLDGPATMVDGVTVAPNKSVRPGQGNILITVTQAAGGLSNPTVFDLGGLSVRADAGGTDTSLVLRVSVPHGAALGTRTLKFQSMGGLFTAPDVVEVTAITVGPTGVDGSPGSAAAPFKTLKAALLTAGAGDTIHLVDGTYNLASGETWGYTVPDGVTIVGDSTEGTLIDGAGATGNPNGFDASTGLTLKSLTIQHFYQGIDIKKASSTVTMEDVALVSNASYGIYLEPTAMGSTINFSGAKGLIDQPGHTAIYVYAATSTITLNGGKVQGGSYVIQFAGNCSGTKLTATGTTMAQLAMNGTDVIYVGASGNAAGTEVTLDKVNITGGVQEADVKGSFTITGSTITQKYGTGIEFAGKTLNVAGTTISITGSGSGINLRASAQGSMSLNGVTIDGGGYGVQQNAQGALAKVRGTTIKNTSNHGYYLYAGDLDMGTATESGDNILGTPTTAYYFCLAATRPSGPTAGAPVSVSGTAFGATGPSDGLRPAKSNGPISGPVSQAPQLYTIGGEDKIVFYGDI